MPTYTPPIADTRFVLDHVLGLERYANLPGFEAATNGSAEDLLPSSPKSPKFGLYLIDEFINSPNQASIGS